MALAIVISAGKALVARRPHGVHLAGLWEFPGGRVEPGETPAAAARRELAEETGLLVEQVEPLTVVVHDYPDRSLRLHAFVATAPRGVLRIDGSRDWVWAGLAELEALEMPAANAIILRALRRQLGRG